LGPDATMTKVDGRVAGGDDRVGDVLADLALGPPGAQPLGDPAVHGVDRGTGAAQRLDLAGRLAHAQVAEHLAGEDLLGAGEDAAEVEDLLGPHVVVEPDRPGRPEVRGDQRVGVVGLVPGQDLQAERAQRRRLGGGLLQARTTMTGSPDAGRTRQVSRSSGSASYPVR